MRKALGSVLIFLTFSTDLSEEESVIVEDFDAVGSVVGDEDFLVEMLKNVP